jgi:hypothetical protein
MSLASLMTDAHFLSNVLVLHLYSPILIYSILTVAAAATAAAAAAAAAVVIVVVVVVQ